MAYDSSEEAERAQIKALGRTARGMGLPIKPPRFALSDAWKDWIHGWVEEDNQRRRLRLPNPDNN